jgi:hypothetical protein
VEDIEFLVDFVAGNLNKVQKMGLEGKSVDPSMCSHCQIHKFLILKM